MAQGWYETTSSFEQGDGGPEDEAERKRRAAVIIQRRVRKLLEGKRERDSSFGRRRHAELQQGEKRALWTPETLHKKLHKMLGQDKEKCASWCPPFGCRLALFPRPSAPLAAALTQTSPD